MAAVQGLWVYWMLALSFLILAIFIWEAIL